MRFGKKSPPHVVRIGAGGRGGLKGLRTMSKAFLHFTLDVIPKNHKSSDFHH